MGQGDVLAKLVNKAAGEAISYEAFKDSVFLDRLMRKKKVKTGQSIKQPLVTGGSGTAEMFTVYGTNDDTTFTDPDKVVTLEAGWKPAGDTVRLSTIQMSQADGPESLYDYVKEQLSIPLESIIELIAGQTITGTGATVNIDGLAALFDNSENYLGQARTVSGAMMTAKFSSSGDNNAMAAGTVAVTAGTLTVTGSATTWTDGADEIFPGDKITITDTGETRRVTEVVSNTSLYVDEPWDTTDASSLATVTSPFINTTKYGTAGLLTAAKLNKAYYAAMDGTRHPTIILGNFDAFESIQSDILQQQRYMSQSAEYGNEKAQGTGFNQAIFVIDGYMPEGKLYGVNENFHQLYCLKGFEKPKLTKAGLLPDVTGTRRASLVGEVNMVLNQINRAPNRNFELSYTS